MVGDSDLRSNDLGAGREAGRAGLRRAEIAPRFGQLRHLEGRVPTPHGLIEVKLDRDGGGEIVIPDGVTAVVRFDDAPLIGGESAPGGIASPVDVRRPRVRIGRRRNPMAMFSPYRVLDLTTERGLLCGQMLGDMGADVVKIEPPGGSAARAIGPFYNDAPHPDRSLYWWAYNRTSAQSRSTSSATPAASSCFASSSARIFLSSRTIPTKWRAAVSASTIWRKSILP